MNLIRSLSSIFLVLAAFYALGCNIVGPAMYIIDGPPSRPAAHQLADVPTVIFIDDRNSQVSPTSLRRVIGDRATQDLMVKKVLTQPNAISSNDAMALAGRVERNDHVMSIEEIGRSVGAKQVVYVQMDYFQDTPDGVTPRPTAACYVRVIDLENRQRVFPPADTEEQARLVQVMIREVDPEMYRTRGGRLKIFESLAQETGSQIGKLFYKHEIRELGGNLNPR